MTSRSTIHFSSCIYRLEICVQPLGSVSAHSSYMTVLSILKGRGSCLRCNYYVEMIPDFLICTYPITFPLILFTNVNISIVKLGSFTPTITGGAHGVMFIVVGNGYDKPSSNPG